MPLRTDRLFLASARARSANQKVGAAAATYAAQQSCPSSCAFYAGGGCYAEDGQVYMGATKRLNDDAETVQAGPLEVAQAEADAIDELRVPEPGWPMRLHTVGDCVTDEAARIVAGAAERWMDRGGGPVWAYTHAWRLVDRASWGRVSVLASCESAAQAELARSYGYAPSIVLAEFQQSSRYTEAGGLEVLPCPAQTKHGQVTCASCRLCFDDGKLRQRGYAIAFEVHGSAFARRQARRALAAPSDPDRRRTLRELLPPVMAAHPDWSDGRIAKLLGYATGSVYEMRLRLEREASANAVRVAR